MLLSSESIAFLQWRRRYINVVLVVPLDQAADSVTGCVVVVVKEISGQGFLIASESLTRQPSGPEIQPEVSSVRLSP